MASGAPMARTLSRSPERTASSAASIFLISGFFKFCGWKRLPDQRPVRGAVIAKRAAKPVIGVDPGNQTIKFPASGLRTLLAQFEKALHISLPA